MLVIRLVLALLLLMASAITAPADAQQPRSCEPDAAKCWYIVFALGDPPKRELFIANHAIRELEAGIRQLELVHMFESPDQPQYVVLTLDFRCRTGEFRLRKASGSDRNGKVASASAPEEAPDWHKAANSPLEPAMNFACNPDVLKNPERHYVSYFTDMIRVPDVVQLARRTFWQQR